VSEERNPYEVMWTALKWYVGGRTCEPNAPEAVHAISAQMGMLESVHLTDEETT
jgi:hypothetical protein